MAPEGQSRSTEVVSAEGIIIEKNRYLRLLLKEAGDLLLRHGQTQIDSNGMAESNLKIPAAEYGGLSDIEWEGTGSSSNVNSQNETEELPRFKRIVFQNITVVGRRHEKENPAISINYNNYHMTLEDGGIFEQHLIADEIEKQIAQVSTYFSRPKPIKPRKSLGQRLKELKNPFKKSAVDKNISN